MVLLFWLSNHSSVSDPARKHKGVATKRATVAARRVHSVPPEELPTARVQGRALGRSTTRRETRQTVALTRWFCQNQMFGLHPHEKGQRMNRRASQSDFLSVSVSVRLALACIISILAGSIHSQPLLLRTETFDADPGWDGQP